MKSCTIQSENSRWLAECLLPEDITVFYCADITRELAREEAVVTLSNILGQCDVPVIRSGAGVLSVTVYGGRIHEFGW